MNDCPESLVSSPEKGLHTAHPVLVERKLDTVIPAHIPDKKLFLVEIFLFGNESLAFKNGVRLWNEGIESRLYGHDPRKIVYKRGDRKNIFILFPGQSDHEIKFYLSPASRTRLSHESRKFAVLYLLAYPETQAFGGFGREGQAGLLNLLDSRSQRKRKSVYSHRGKGNHYFPGGKFCEEPLHDSLYCRMIAGGKRKQREFFIAGVPVGLQCKFCNPARTPGSNRLPATACLAEKTPLPASSHYFNGHAVMDYFS